MTIQEAEKLFYQRVQLNAGLREIQARVNNGTATFEDTFQYTDIVSDILGNVLSQNMPSTPDGERQKLCEYLLRHLYSDTNEMCAAVQKSLDKAQNLHIAPQTAPFPEKRVRKMAHSLEDKTVPEETIARRAESSATIGRSFHDDYIRTNAAFRESAGLRSYITRMGGAKCCDWCAGVSGKFTLNDAPDGIWGRHDNCKCSIIYDSKRSGRQVLRGKPTPDGSSKGWTVTGEETQGFQAHSFQSGEKPQGFAPVAFAAGNAPQGVSPRLLSAEQAARIQNYSLTNQQNRSMIRNIRLDDIVSATTGTSISKEVTEYIYKILSENRNQFKFDRVVTVSIDPKIVMQTDPVQNGTFYDIVLNLNANFLGGKTVAQIDEEIRQAQGTVAQSFKEAIIHEIYHAKTYYGKNKGEIDAIYDVLGGLQISGISQTALKDGLECIAESGVLFERGSINEIPEKAKALLREYLGVNI